MIPSLLAVSMAGGICHAQFQSGRQSTTLDLPSVSQHAWTTQRIGLTKISLAYSRPLVNGRKIWGDLVKYDAVWRAGANENTAIEFSDPVIVEGKELPAGTYGLHMMPGKDTWTMIFSKNSTSWGSFSYDKEEDALRVTVSPRTAEFHEALTYDFDNPHPDSVEVTMKWEKLAVPFKVGVDTKAITLTSMKHQLRNLAGFTWIGFDDAATWLADNNMDLDQALKWANESSQIPQFQNLQTKSRILAMMGKKEEADAAFKLAMEKANVIDAYNYARTVQRQGKQDEALAVYRTLKKKDPDSWITHLGLARVSVATHDVAGAKNEMQAAITGAPEGQKPMLEKLAKRLDDGEDINK
jgi:tetratricopeptide (TPR) repeat protein